jgi:hypothetical protein
MSLKKFIKDSATDVQTKLCDKAGQFVNRYSLRQRKIGLVVFGLIAGTFCFLLIMGIIGSEDSAKAIQVDSISRPKSIYGLSDSLKSVPDKMLDSLRSILRQFYSDKMDH